MSSDNNDDEKPDDRRDNLNEAARWSVLLDGGQMSDAARVDFQSWLDEPRNARALSETRTLIGLIQELPHSVAERLRRKVFQKALADDAARASSKIVLPPGSTLANVTKFLLTRNSYKRYAEPVIADMQQEYIEAVAARHEWHARWIAIRGHLLVIPGWIYALVTGKLVALLRGGH